MSHIFVGRSRLGILRTNSFIINDFTSKPLRYVKCKTRFQRFRDVTQRMFVFCYRRFGSTYRPQIQRSISRSIIVPNYHPALPEDQKSQLYQDGSLVLHRKEGTWEKKNTCVHGFQGCCLLRCEGMQSARRASTFQDILKNAPLSFYHTTSFDFQTNFCRLYHQKLKLQACEYS